MEMAERLLFGNQLDVIAARVPDQLANFLWRKRPTGRANQRMRLARERVLHIKGVHVEFEKRFGANLALDVIDSRHRATADVVRDGAPAHRRPIDDLHAGNKCVCRFAANELLQRLQTIESSGRSFSRNDNFAQADRQNISFVTQLLARVYGGSLQSLLDPWQIDSAHQYLAARAVSAESHGQSGRLLHIVDEILRRETIFD